MLYGFSKQHTCVSLICIQNFPLELFVLEHNQNSFCYFDMCDLRAFFGLSVEAPDF